MLWSVPFRLLTIGPFGRPSGYLRRAPRWPKEETNVAPRAPNHRALLALDCQAAGCFPSFCQAPTRRAIIVQAARDVSYAYERILPVLGSTHANSTRDSPYQGHSLKKRRPCMPMHKLQKCQIVNNSQGKIYRKLLGWHRAPRGDHRPR